MGGILTRYGDFVIKELFKVVQSMMSLVITGV